MAWDELFADLAASAEALDARERDAEVVERTRSAWSDVRWVQRCVGGRVALRVEGLGAVEGRVVTVAATWLLLRGDGAADWVVALDAVLGLSGAVDTVTGTAPGGEVAARTGWLGAWTVLVRDRAPVQVVRRDGSRVEGVPVRVGADFAELRAPGGGRPEVVPHAAVSAVRCPRDG